MERARSIEGDRIIWALGLLGVLTAAGLRLWRLSTVPFGWHPDEATKALLARDILAGKYFPAFFSAFTGREALYVYLEAAFFALLGEGIFAARLLSALSGILTVALTYTLGKQLFNRRVGLFAAILLGASLWHLIASRNGYRAVIQPLVQVPVILLLFRALTVYQVRSKRPFILAGLWLGLTQYTYTAARFFPVLVATVVACAFFLWPTRVWSRRVSLLILFIAAGIVFLPLGLHFVQNPVDFYGRAAQVSVFSEAWASGDPQARLWQSVKETARMFTVWGDINYRFNIAGQPVFGLLDGLLFYAGLVLCGWRLARSGLSRRLAYATVLLWFAIMLLPMTLSAESLPYYQRAIGVLPAIYIFPAVALDALFVRLARLGSVARRHQGLSVFLLAVVLVIWLAVRVSGDYFFDWHLAERNDDDRRVAMMYVADYLKQKEDTEQIYLSTQYVQHPTLAFLAPQDYDQVVWFDASQSFPIPAQEAEATYVILMENRAQELLLDLAPGLQKKHTGYDRFGRPVFQVYQKQPHSWPVAGDTSPAYWSWKLTFDEEDERNEIALPVNIGDVVAFRGYSKSPENAQAGELLEIVLFWEILKRPQRPYTFFVHLLDRDSRVIAGYDANTYATAFWPPEGGELLLNYFPLQIPADVAAGVYQLEIGVYHQSSGERLPVLQDGVLVADRLLLDPVLLNASE